MPSSVPFHDAVYRISVAGYLNMSYVRVHCMTNTFMNVLERVPTYISATYTTVLL